MRPDFLIIPYQLFTDPKLQPGDRGLYGAIYWFQHLKDGRCTASNRTLGQIAGLKERAVRGGLERLETNGYIKRVYKDATSKHRKEIQALIQYTLGTTVPGARHNRAGGARHNRATERVINVKSNISTPIGKKPVDPNRLKSIKRDLLARGVLQA